MKKIIIGIILIITIAGLFSFFALPHLAGAAEFTAKAPSWTGLVPCGRNSGNNGETSVCTLCHLIVGFQRLIQYGLYIVIAFAFAGIFFAGIMYVISSGDEGMITKAKSFLSASLIGFAVVLGAWIIVNTTLWVIGTKGDLGVGVQGWSKFSCSDVSMSGTGTRITNPSNPAVDAVNNSCDQITGMNTECLASCASYNRVAAICGSAGQVCCKKGNPAQACNGVCRTKYTDGTGGCLNTETQLTGYSCPQSQVCCFGNAVGPNQVGPVTN